MMMLAAGLSSHLSQVMLLHYLAKHIIAECAFFIYHHHHQFNTHECSMNKNNTHTITHWRKVTAAYRRVYDLRHLQADCQEPGSAPEPYAR